MPDNEDLTAGARFAPSVPARYEPFPLKGCGALDWGMQSRLARIFRPDTTRAEMGARRVRAAGNAGSCEAGPPRGRRRTNAHAPKQSRPHWTFAPAVPSRSRRPAW